MDSLKRPSCAPRFEHVRKEEIRQRIGREHISTDIIEDKQLLWYEQIKMWENDRCLKKGVRFLSTKQEKNMVLCNYMVGRSILNNK